MKLKSNGVVNPFDCILWPGLCSGNRYLCFLKWLVTAVNVEGVLVNFLIFLFVQFFSKCFPIFVTSIEILKFHTSYTPFLDGCNALCWSRIKMIVTGKNLWQWISSSNLIVHTSTRPRGRPGLPIFIFHMYHLKIFYFVLYIF